MDINSCVSENLLACLDAFIRVCVYVCTYVCMLARLLVRDSSPTKEGARTEGTGSLLISSVGQRGPPDLRPSGVQVVLSLLSQNHNEQKHGAIQRSKRTKKTLSCCGVRGCFLKEGGKGRVGTTSGGTRRLSQYKICLKHG